MARSLTSAPRQAEDKALDLPLIGATPNRQPTVNPLEGGWILPLIACAIDQTMQRKEAAILMGLDAGQMTRQLSGEGHLSVRRLGMLGEEFWLALADGLRRHFGIDNDAQRLERALDGLAASVKVIGEIARKGVTR